MTRVFKDVFCCTFSLSGANESSLGQCRSQQRSYYRPSKSNRDGKDRTTSDNKEPFIDSRRGGDLHQVVSQCKAGTCFGSALLDRSSSPGGQPNEEPTSLLAYSQDHRQWCRYGQRMAGRTRTHLPQSNLGRTCSDWSNRLVRTRMLIGVGRTVSNGRPYPIYLALVCSQLSQTF